MFLFANINLYTLGKYHTIIWYSLKVVDKNTVFLVDFCSINKTWSPFVLQFRYRLWVPTGARFYQAHSHTMINLTFFMKWPSVTSSLPMRKSNLAFFFFFFLFRTCLYTFTNIYKIAWLKFLGWLSLKMSYLELRVHCS